MHGRHGTERTIHSSGRVTSCTPYSLVLIRVEQGPVTARTKNGTHVGPKCQGENAIRKWLPSHSLPELPSKLVAFQSTNLYYTSTLLRQGSGKIRGAEEERKEKDAGTTGVIGWYQTGAPWIDPANKSAKREVQLLLRRRTTKLGELRCLKQWKSTYEYEYARSSGQKHY